MPRRSRRSPACRRCRPSRGSSIWAAVREEKLVLARALQTPIVAVDPCRPFLDRLEQRAAAVGLRSLVETRCGTIEALDEPTHSIDLVWSEGALYNAGVGAALKLLHPLMRAGAVLAFTELTWFADAPPAEAAAFWSQAYPAMAGTDDNIGKARRHGFEPVTTFRLPEQDWRQFYDPLQERIEQLRPQCDRWPELAQAIGEAQREIEIFTRHRDSYGYVFYILRRP